MPTPTAESAALTVIASSFTGGSHSPEKIDSFHIRVRMETEWNYYNNSSGLVTKIVDQKSERMIQISLRVWVVHFQTRRVYQKQNFMKRPLKEEDHVSHFRHKQSWGSTNKFALPPLGGGMRTRWGRRKSLPAAHTNQSMVD